MSKVTSKRQLTLPKAIADQYGIRPGDELEWFAAAEGLRVGLVRPRDRGAQELSLEEKLDLFDQDSSRVDKLQAAELAKARRSGTRRRARGWRREDLYTRGLPR